MAPRFRCKATALVRTEDPEVHKRQMLLVKGQGNIDATAKRTVPKLPRTRPFPLTSALLPHQRAPSASAETFLITSSRPRSSASIT
jgi:hypothetical protein